MKTGSRRVARRALGAIVVGLIFGVLAREAAAESCGPHPAQVNFRFDIPKPTIDNTRPQPELQRLGQTRETQDHEGLILGLYVAEMGIEGQAQFKITTNGSSACVQVAAVDVRYFLQNRRIYIVNTWKSGSCPYTAILGHERKHEATDERILREKTPIAKRRIADALSYASTAPVPLSQRDAQQKRLAKIVEDALKKSTSEMLDARKAAQHAVDAGREYQRVADSCTQFRQPS
jgi:hypothetical protein